MHRTPLGALTAALALLTTALVVPRESAIADSVVATSVPSVVAVSVTSTAAQPTLAPVQFSRPVRACRSGLIALTFDDGPSASVTMGLVRTLQRLDVPATFFMVGSRVRANPEIARSVQQAGFQIANHSWSHAQLTALPRKAVLRELSRTRQEFVAQRIVASSLMRPPFGAKNRRVLKNVRSLGLRSVMWSIDSFDWRGGTPRQIAHRVISALRRNGTNLVLQHDGVTNSPNSAKAVPLIVAAARRRGYCFADLGATGKVAVPRPVVRVTAVPGTEDGAAPVRIKVELDRPTTRAVSVRVQTISGSARAGEDFVPITRRVVFPRGVSTAWLTVPVIDDDLVEPVEDLRVVLDNPFRLTLPRSELLATVFSDDH